MYGNSYKSTLIAVIVPEQTVLYEWARENGLEEDMTALCKNANLKKLILKDMTQHGKAGDLKGFEQVNKLTKLFEHVLGVKKHFYSSGKFDQEGLQH